RLDKCRAIEGDCRLWIRRVVQCLKSNIERQNQKLIVKSFIPLHFPVSGSSTTLSSAFPYCGGAFGFNIWNGFPPRAARGRTPSVFSFRTTGGGDGFGPFFWRALKVWAPAVAQSAIKINIVSSFIFVSRPAKRASSCRLHSSAR